MDKPYYQIEMMSYAMNVLTARNQLRRMDASAYPNMKSKMQSKMHKQFFKEAYPENFKKKAIRNEDLILDV